MDSAAIPKKLEVTALRMRPRYYHTLLPHV